MSTSTQGIGHALERAHAWAVGQPLLHDFTQGVRILLAAGFIPPGLVKLLGHRFTQLPTTGPVGAIFEALYQTGGYWNFLGACQVLAGVLLLVPATATLGAALFLPILVNILVLTISVGFRGTPFVVAAMLLANVYLVCWDGDRFRQLLPGLHGRTSWHGTAVRAQTRGTLRYAWWGAAAAALVVTFALRGLAPGGLSHAQSLLLALALPATGLIADLLRHRIRRQGPSRA